MYLALLLLLAFSAFFSASETALSSVNRIRMKNKADDGDKKAQRVLGLSDDYDRTLSAILIGNTVVNLTASSISTVIATSLLGRFTSSKRCWLRWCGSLCRSSACLQAGAPVS